MKYENDQDTLRVGREWISRSTANFIYGLSTFILAGATAFMLIGAGGKGGHGSAMALEIFVFTKMLPLTFIALLASIKIASPRWKKALIPIFLWGAMVVARLF